MKVPKKIIVFLEKNKIKYEIIKHRTVYTAYDKAQTLKVKPKIIGKTLILKSDKDLVIALIPGQRKLDKNKFKKTVNFWLLKSGQKPVKSIDFALEQLIKNKFKGVKIGNIPPFGKLWGLPTFIDKSLIKEKEIILNSGDYNFSIKIKTKELKKFDFISGDYLSRQKK